MSVGKYTVVMTPWTLTIDHWTHVSCARCDEDMIDVLVRTVSCCAAQPLPADKITAADEMAQLSHYSVHLRMSVSKSWCHSFGAEVT